MPYRHPPWFFIFALSASAFFVPCRCRLVCFRFVLACFLLFERAVHRRAVQGVAHRYGSPGHAA
jgi:hypothetical protein